MGYAKGSIDELGEGPGFRSVRRALGVTAFGLVLTPVFYVALRALTGNRPLRQHGEATVATAGSSVTPAGPVTPPTPPSGQPRPASEGQW